MNNEVKAHESFEIVIVEDDPNDLEFILHAIRSSKVANKITALSDGQEALDFIFGEGNYAGREQKIISASVILLDLKLPKVDGLEVLKCIKSDERTRSIPVVMLTSSSEDRDIIEAYKLGANSYIVKPVDFQKFIESVRSIGSYWVLINHKPHL